jgi:hypothetical protein
VGGVDVYRTEFDIVYVVPDVPRGNLPTPSNPDRKTDGTVGNTGPGQV